jgi:hypothetical protein
MAPATQKPATGHDTTERLAPAAMVTGFDQVPAALGPAVVVVEATVVVVVRVLPEVVVDEPP